MNVTKFSLSSKLIVLACLIFDIAVVTAFFIYFEWFTVLAPWKSLIMLLVLLIGLALINGAIAFPNALFNMMGIAYSTYIIFLIILYAFIANVLSVFLIYGSLAWYIVWQLFILAIFLGLLAIVGFFSKGISGNIRKTESERTAVRLLQMQLMEIDDILFARRREEGMDTVIEAFAKLKERINASTPFMRIDDTGLVGEIENKIKERLETLQTIVIPSMTDSDNTDTHDLIEEIRKLTLQREQLIIK